MYVIVVGLSAVGKTLAKTLVDKKHTVAVLEINEERCKEFASEVDALVIHGDAEDKDNLVNAGAENANALVAATDDDSVNLMVVTMAKDLGVPNLIVVVRNPEHEELFRRLGVTIIMPDQIVTEYLYRSLFKVTDFLLIDKGEVLSLNVAENSEAVNKNIKKVRLPNDDRVVAVLRDGKPVYPDKDVTFKPRDNVLIYMSKAENLKRIAELFTGKKY